MKKRVTKVIMILSCFFVFAAACGKSTEAAWQKKYELGEKYLLEENYEEAIVAFTEAIEIDPNQALAYLGRAGAYMGSGETEENLALAQADYEKALALDDSLVNAYLGLANVYVQKGDTESAIEQLEAGYDKTGDEKLHQEIEKYVPELSENELSVLQELYRLMEAGDAAGALNYLHQDSYSISMMVDYMMGYPWDEEHPYLFDGTKLKQVSDGFGMTFFHIGDDTDGFHTEISYGEIRNGKVEGEALVLCEHRLSKDYAVGTWKSGELIEGTVTLLNEEENFGHIFEGTFSGDIFWNGTVKDIELSYVLEIPIEDGHLVGGTPESEPDGSIVYWYYSGESIWDGGGIGFEEEKYKNGQYKKQYSGMVETYELSI